MEDAPTDKHAFRRAELLEDQLRIMTESALFKGELSSHRDRISAKVAAARKSARKGEIDESLELSVQGEALLGDAAMSRSFVWRLTHIHQIPIFAYHVAWFSALLYLALIEPDGRTLWGVIPGFTPELGAMGAVLRGIWWAGHHVTRRSFRTVFIVAHLGAPVVGALLGVLSYLLYRTGLLVLGESTTAEGSFFPMAFAFAAGFNWQWIVARLEGALAQSK